MRYTDICYSQRTTYSVHMTLGRPAVISGQSVDNVDNVGSWFPSMYIGLKLSFQNNAVIASVIFVNENENENYQKRKNNDFVNEN